MIAQHGLNVNYIDDASEERRKAMLLLEHESPLEWDFLCLFSRFASPPEIRSQVSFDTKEGRFRVDFLINGTVAVELDGKDFHDPLKDHLRDDVLLRDTTITEIIRISGSAWYYGPWDVMRAISQWHPDWIGGRPLPTSVLDGTLQTQYGVKKISWDHQIGPRNNSVVSWITRRFKRSTERPAQIPPSPARRMAERQIVTTILNTDPPWTWLDRLLPDDFFEPAHRHMIELVKASASGAHVDVHGLLLQVEDAGERSILNALFRAPATAEGATAAEGDDLERSRDKLWGALRFLEEDRRHREFRLSLQSTIDTDEALLLKSKFKKATHGAAPDDQIF